MSERLAFLRQHKAILCAREYAEWLALETHQRRDTALRRAFARILGGQWEGYG